MHCYWNYVWTISGDVSLIVTLDNVVLPEGAVLLFRQTKAIASLIAQEQAFVDLVSLATADQHFAGNMAFSLWEEGSYCYQGFEFYREQAGIHLFSDGNWGLSDLSDLRLDDLSDMQSYWQRSQDLLISSDYWSGREARAANEVIINQKQAFAFGALIADAQNPAPAA
mgnify:FL=1